MNGLRGNRVYVLLQGASLTQRFRKHISSVMLTNNKTNNPWKKKERKKSDEVFQNGMMDGEG